MIGWAFYRESSLADWMREQVEALLFSPVLFAALLVGSSGQDAVPAAVLASAAAWLALAAMRRRSAA